MNFPLYTLIFISILLIVIGLTLDKILKVLKDILNELRFRK